MSIVEPLVSEALTVWMLLYVWPVKVTPPEYYSTQKKQQLYQEKLRWPAKGELHLKNPTRG